MLIDVPDPDFLQQELSGCIDLSQQGHIQIHYTALEYECVFELKDLFCKNHFYFKLNVLFVS